MGVKIQLFESAYRTDAHASETDDRHTGLCGCRCNMMLFGIVW